MPAFSPLLRHRRQLLAVALAVGLPLLAASQAQAQAPMPANWPSKPMRVIVPYPAGGNSDAIARFVADKLGAALGQPMVVENKGGAGAIIDTEAAARAAGDGYNFLVAPNAVFTITQHLRRIPYDPVNDFIPIAQLSGSYSIAAARKDAPFNSLTELATLAAKEPGKYTFGSAGLATATHLSGEMLSSVAKIKLLHVPYKGSADAVNALAGGQVDIVIDGAAVNLVKAGRVLPIVAFGSQRHPELPQVPSLAETGIPVRMAHTAGWGLFVPKGTPAAITQRLSKALQQVLEQPETQSRLQRTSTLAAWRSPEELRRTLDADYQFYAELLPQIGLRPED